MVTPRSESTNTKEPPPPPVSAIFLIYALLGTLLSFTAGREPGTFPTDDILLELSPTLIVVCLFLVSYSLLDVMAVGIAKHKHNLGSESYGPSMNNPPEEVYLAQRVQTNQVEQLHGFLIASISFSFVVNGKVGAALALIWAVLRRMYASTYSASIGKPISQAGLTKFTIPAYFVLNAMLMGTVVQCLRAIMK
mmetsp:Transcript_26301/g.39828  ORF Transcript_26301/g.39828 Transcript_26301/m.39828 type:complete len:193 (-) Transcript_26301:122-700(-)